MTEAKPKGKKVYISVILIAHDRKEYILDALKSVESQTLSKDFFEIIVVKNFQDDIIDSYIEHLHGKNIITNAVNAGQKLSIGLLQSSGEVISFLADDDKFKPSKLEYISKIFKNKPNLVYYHNSFSTIDTSGAIIHDSFYRNPKNIIENKSGNFNLSTISRMVHFKGYHNDSSISVRKEFYLPYFGTLKQLKAAWDAFFFFLALDRRSEILVDNKELTHFRLHSGLSYSYEDESTFTESRNFLAENYQSDFTVIQKILENVRLKEYVDYFASVWKVIEIISSKSNSKRIELRTLGSLLKYLRYSMPQNRIATFIAAIACLLFPNKLWTIQFIYSRKIHKIKY